MQGPHANAATRDALRAALQQFHQAPGRYNTRRREPALLFVQLPAVLHIATGRSADGPDAALQQAALFFIRVALLDTPRDHYGLLGLPRTATDAAVKERYRQLMRLVHPDFAGAAPWAASAAARLNGAYAVLSSPVQRARYDKELADAQPRPSPPRAHPGARPRPAAAPAAHGRWHWQRLRGRRVGREKVAMLAALLALAGIAGAALLLAERSPPMELVRRPSQAASGMDAAVEPDAELRQEPAVLAARAAAGPGAWDPTAPASSLPHTLAAAAARVSQAQAQASILPAAAGPMHPDSAAPGVIASTASAAATPAAAATATPAAANIPPALPGPGAATLAVSGTPAPAAAKVAASASASMLPTLTDVQPQLGALLQAIETGRAEGILALVEAGGRHAGLTQALAAHLERTLHGRASAVQAVQFLASQADGRLVVTGRLMLEPRGLLTTAKPQPLVLRAHFDMRDGAPVLTGLALADGS